jgi:hypothetical protein
VSSTHLGGIFEGEAEKLDLIDLFVGVYMVRIISSPSADQIV